MDHPGPNTQYWDVRKCFLHDFDPDPDLDVFGWVQESEAVETALALWIVL